MNLFRQLMLRDLCLYLKMMTKQNALLFPKFFLTTKSTTPKLNQSNWSFTYVIWFWRCLLNQTDKQRLRTTVLNLRVTLYTTFLPWAVGLKYTVLNCVQRISQNWEARMINLRRIYFLSSTGNISRKAGQLAEIRRQYTSSAICKIKEE